MITLQLFGFGFSYGKKYGYDTALALTVYWRSDGMAREKVWYL